MSTASEKFAFPARLLHWVMALLIRAMLLIGIGTVNSTSDRYEMLVEIHNPLRILILVLVVVRLFVRLDMPPPATFGTINADILDRLDPNLRRIIFWGLVLGSSWARLGRNQLRFLFSRY
ncbi:cytochrome b/b6 domain-containing protein [Paraburkholderia sp. RL17-337-BIB-A]|uniref:cytochrome b/b6 domain-containing protein n=1 Tax=Paraburkholderia sp. RL17-337-BIB-A TaxID=3031636 RepID=UPI0038B7498D